MAFIAVRAGAGSAPQTLGIVRCAVDPDNIEAEFAIILRSDLEARGLCQLLLGRMIDFLVARGTHRAVGDVQGENATMNARRHPRSATASL